MSDYSQDPQDQNQSMPSSPRGGDSQAGANPKKLFVGNLSWGLTNEDLQQLFAEFGTVEEAFVLTDKFSGRSKGFGFVTMSTAEEAQAAVEALHQRDVDGRSIVVNVAQPPKPREEWSRGGNDRRGGGDRRSFNNNDRRGGGGNFRRGR
jgi:RNA recognition motif-containing protein